jgi:hypothetical protein
MVMSPVLQWLPLSGHSLEWARSSGGFVQAIAELVDFPRLLVALDQGLLFMRLWHMLTPVATDVLYTGHRNVQVKGFSQTNCVKVIVSTLPTTSVGHHQRSKRNPVLGKEGPRESNQLVAPLKTRQSLGHPFFLSVMQGSS